MYADESKKVYTTLGMTRSLDAGEFDVLPEYIKGTFIGNVVGSIFVSFSPLSSHDRIESLMHVNMMGVERVQDWTHFLERWRY